MARWFSAKPDIQGFHRRKKGRDSGSCKKLKISGKSNLSRAKVFALNGLNDDFRKSIGKNPFHGQTMVRGNSTIHLSFCQHRPSCIRTAAPVMFFFAYE